MCENQDCNCENYMYYQPPMELDKSNLNGIEFDDIAFQRGVSDASYVVGMYTALINSGMTEDSIINYLLNKENIEHNLEVAKIKKEEAIIMGKTNNIKQETESI